MGLVQCCENPAINNQGQITMNMIPPLSGKVSIDKYHALPELSEPILQYLQTYKPFHEQFKQNSKIVKIGQNFYQGSLNEEGNPSGFGRIYYPNGSIYIGQFQNGEAINIGHFILQNGTFYHGKIRNRKAQDENGIYQQKDLKYRGGFADNNFQGFGSLETSSYKLKGTFEKGKIREGELRWKQETNQSDLENVDFEYIYYGLFDQDGNFHGNGKLTSPKGTYEGQFNHGNKNGEGQFNFNNGLKFVGTYKNNVKQGKGTIFRQKNNIAYQGGFSKGIPHGKGWIPLQDGTPNYLEFDEGISSLIIKDYEEA